MNIHASLVFIYLYIIGFQPKFQKEIVETNSVIYNTLQFDQYSRLAICLYIFRFSDKNSKTN